MELLEGESLADLLGRVPRMEVIPAIKFILPVIDALAMAHGRGIIHRDIKPENIFIAQDEQGRLQPKVLDFGIAKRGGGPVSRLTQEGAVLGSPQYFSPEQAEGVEEIDFRSDMWAVGVVLYELISGFQPFNGRNYNALIRSISQDAPKPLTELGVADAQLWMIISRCLNKKPRERWGSLWELGEALALWLFEQGVQVDAASRSLKDGWLSGSASGVKTLVGGSGPPTEAALLRPISSRPPPPRDRGRSAGFVSTIRRPPGDRAFWKQPWAWLALLVFAAVVGALLGIRELAHDEGSASQAQADAVIHKAPASTSAPVAAVPAPETPASPPVDEAATSTATRSPPRGTTGTSTKKAGGKAPAPPARDTAAASPEPSPQKTRSGVDTEFGF
jgi:serine/threonine-protein kinase